MSTTTKPRTSTNGKAPDQPATAPATLIDNSIAAVPDQAFYDRYISRKVGGKTDLEMLTFALKKHYNVLIEGPTGAGKTSAVLAFAAQNKMRFYATPSSIGLEPSQLFGKFIPSGEGNQLVWQDGPVTDLVRHGGVLLLNEVNFIPARVSTALFGLLDVRREMVLLDHKGEVIKAHNDLLIVADMNPNYRGTQPLNEAFRNRFPIKQAWDYDTVVESKLVPYGALRRLAQDLRQSEEIITPVSTNLLIDFVTMAKDEDMGWDFAVTNLIAHFSSDERPTVTTLLNDTHGSKIKGELFKVLPKKAQKKLDDKPEWNPKDYDLTVVGTAENPNPINHPDWEASYGIYNVNWDLDAQEIDDESGEAL